MKVTNMTGRTGKPVPNQFVIEGATITLKMETVPVKVTIFGTMFQSYRSNIAFKSCSEVYLDSHYWNYSPTTSKYRNQFLNETTAQTQAKIASGEYILTNLN